MLKSALQKLALATAAVTIGGAPALAQDAAPATAPKTYVITSTDKEPMVAGKVEPTWDSLRANYAVPDWFRDAKFGIWAHWGPQCQPEQGDWYARGMYEEGKPQYKSHLTAYGPQSQFGFKDVINTWHAEKWDPNELVSLYKRAGAQYFFALANHHDNFDLWDSKFQEWNSVAIGPKKNLIDGWAKAARANGMKFGVSVHASHAWSWYGTSTGADKAGPNAGVPYDGKVTKEDGKGKWWDGLDPQELYEQRHAPTGLVWDWNRGVLPDQKYVDKFYNRTMDLVTRYQPDLIYFDDTALPLDQMSDAGLKIAANYYNASMAANGGKLNVMLFGKVLKEDQRKAITWDIERGASNRIEPFPWQTDTCIGAWHYKRSLFDKAGDVGGYKSTAIVIHMLADIVSKNGNLLLNIPVRGDGSIDDKERGIVEGIAKWMDVNKESIFGTRPFKVFGEGPASDGAPIQAQGFNEGKGKAFTPEDVRYTQKGDTLYVISLGVPSKALELKALGSKTGNLAKPITGITILGSDEKIEWKAGEDALEIQPGKVKPGEISTVFKISTGG